MTSGSARRGPIYHDHSLELPTSVALDDARQAMPWAGIVFRADDNDNHTESHLVDDRWRSPIFLPRWACRLTGRIRRLRLEFLHDISGPDIIAEGVVARAHNDQNLGKCPVGHDGVMYPDLRSLWAAGWDRINGKKAPWKDNPLVWAIDFERTT